MTSLPTVLFFTYPEHGQANVSLATSYELALAGVNVYISSFASLRARVARLQELIDRHHSRSGGKATGSIIFCECKGVTSYLEALARHGVNMANLPHPPGVSGALELYSKTAAVCFPWGPEEYSAAIESCKEIITTIKPNLVVADSLFFAARDVCQLVDQKFMIIYATGLKEAATPLQPRLAAFWKYPVFVFQYILTLSSSTHRHPGQSRVGFSVPSEVVADSPQHLSRYSTHTIGNFARSPTDRSPTQIPWAW